MSLEDLREFLQEQITQTFFYSDNVIIEQLQASMTELRKMKLDFPPPGKADELPRKPLGQELPVLLSVQPSRGKPSLASGLPGAGLSLRIISYQPDSISPDQSPSKDPKDLDTADKEETPLPSPDRIIIHSQAPLTPEGSPLMGPPPYQPPGSQVVVTEDPPATLEQERELADAASSVSTADSSVVTRSADQSSCKIPRTLSAPVVLVASQMLVLAQSESLSAAEKAEDSCLVQLLEQASALTTNKNLNQDSSEASENTQTLDTSWNEHQFDYLFIAWMDSGRVL